MNTKKTKIIHCTYPGCDWAEEGSASSRRLYCPRHSRIRIKELDAAYRADGKKGLHKDYNSKVRRHSHSYEAHRKSIVERHGVKRDMSETDVYTEPSEFGFQARKLG